MAQLVNDHKKASNLIRITVALVPIQCLVSYWLFKETMLLPQLIILYVWLTILFGIAQAIRSGVRWVKWLFLCLVAIGFTVQCYGAIAIFTVSSLKNLPLSDIGSSKQILSDGVFAILQDALQLYAAYLLFVSTKKTDNEEDNEILNIEKIIET